MFGQGNDRSHTWDTIDSHEAVHPNGSDCHCDDPCPAAMEHITMRHDTLSGGDTDHHYNMIKKKCHVSDTNRNYSSILITVYNYIKVKHVSINFKPIAPRV